MKNMWKWVFAVLLPVFPAPAVFAQSAPLLCGIGWRSHENKDYSAAAAAYTHAIELDPSGDCGTGIRGAAYNNRGLAYYSLKQYTGAIADFKKAHSLNPGLSGGLLPYLKQAYGRRGAGYYLRGSYAAALADLMLAPDNPDIHKARVLAEKARRKPPPADTGSPGEIAVTILFIVAAVVLMLFVMSKPGGRLLAELESSLNPPLPAKGEDKAAPSTPAALGITGIKALIDQGRYNEALEAAQNKKSGQQGLADYSLLFEIYLQLGDFIRAGLILSAIDKEVAGKHPVERLRGRLNFKENPVRGSGPPAELPPAVYLALARLAKTKGRADWAAQLSRMAVDCLVTTAAIRENPRDFSNLAAALEKDGEINSALELYQLLIETGRPSPDVARRYQKLKALAAAEAARPAGPPQARQFVPAPAAIKTGVQAAGQVLDNRYELRETIGEGAMGMVYAAWDRQAGVQVAVKRMKSWLRRDPGEYNRFRGEAETMGKMKHPNVVGFHGTVDHCGDTYIVLDYVAGRPLSDILGEKGRFPLDECRSIFKGVCEGVHYAHTLKIVHRDLKPANIMLEPNGRPWVMDFGLASQLQDGETHAAGRSAAGTLFYMAPEQHRGTVRRESDIYAMGVCLYEMLTGKLPFMNINPQVLEKLKNDRNYEEVGAGLPWLPAGIDNLVSRALEPEPSMRYADALDFWAALRDL